ncbi:MAG TPA: cytochrome c [Candidatus Baltobacteraceae bacterium]
MQKQFIPLIAVGALVLATACAGGSHASSSASPAAGATGAMSAMAATSASDGAKVFDTNCSSCHGSDGKGSAGAFPPLAGNPVVVGKATAVIHIVKDGLTGKISVAGQTYNGVMPKWGTALSAADIASAITYIRSAWGNKGGPVTPAQVVAAK